MTMFHFCFFERMRYGGRCPCSGEADGSIYAFGDLSPDMAVNLCSLANDTVRWTKGFSIFPVYQNQEWGENTTSPYEDFRWYILLTACLF
jgi:hypothetical protein